MAIVISITGVELGIDGGFIDGISNNNHGWQYRNSDTYLHTNRTRLLTQRFNDISNIFPIYERLEQLMALSYGFKELRQMGFEPSAEEMECLQKKKGDFESAGNALGVREYAMYLPLIHKPGVN